MVLPSHIPLLALGKVGIWAGASFLLAPGERILFRKGAAAALIERERQP